jgi:putative DNA methylase
VGGGPLVPAVHSEDQLMSTAIESRTYDRRASAVFCKTTEKFGGLSNMAGGFPLRVNGVDILTSEALYQACRFPQLPDVQRVIIAQKSPMTAKMKSKPHRSKTRMDWDAVRTRVMRWCLRVKLAQNWLTFRELLLATGDRPIVEESKKDDFWGAFAQEDGTLVGRNVLGRLLMELREELKKPTAEALKRVEPVPIPDFKLFGEPIEAVQAWRMPVEPVIDPDLSPAEAALWANVLQSQWGDVADLSRVDRLPEPVVSNQHVAAATMAVASPVQGATKQRAAVVRRLIEVDLPIARISAHARREKSIRHGHISTLHIWWARRPLAACRAVICAALWPDPADEHCPQSFRDAAAHHLVAFAKRVNPEKISGEKQQLQATLSPESLARWEAFTNSNPPLDPRDTAHQNVLRFALLDFIADFANWDNATVPAYLDTSRALTQAAHEALGGEPGTRPVVVDPFAGGGSIPLEALRVGADAFASDLNPVAVLLNKVVLEYIPKYGQTLGDEVRKWGHWIKEQAEKELAEFYPKDPDGATPIAYLWARTIRCEGGGCGAEVPLMRSLWLAKKANKAVALKIMPNSKAQRVDFEIIRDAKAKDVGDGTVKRGSATCPCCGYTTPVKSVREQLKLRKGGAADARLFCVISTRPNVQGRFYRVANQADVSAVTKAAAELEKRKREYQGSLSLVPDEMLDLRGIRHTWAMIYGMDTWGTYFSPRQLLALTTLVFLTASVRKKLASEVDLNLAIAVNTCLALAVDRQADFSSSIASWWSGGEKIQHTFARQAIPMIWDFVEGNPWSESTGCWSGAYEWGAMLCDHGGVSHLTAGHAQQGSATKHPLPSDSVAAVITDPPYYDAVPYAYLADFFHVWLRRMLGDVHPDMFTESAVPKEAEIVVDRRHELSHSTHDIAFYKRELQNAFAESRRLLTTDGIGTIVFASKTTSSWEAILSAVVDAGWVITGSWPIDTEMANRVSALGQARLASSVHLVCRPRSNNDVGDWRDVLSELPQRMHEWMPRLASEGVVGADAIFACLGPALEIFSRFSRVEKTNGDVVPLGDLTDDEGRVIKEGYLSHVWAAVSREALSTIFRDADASGLEPDARLTAMWLWTVGGGAPAANGKPSADGEPADDGSEDEDEASGKAVAPSGFTLEFDAARKIAQGLGVHLERSESIVEVKGDKARLLPVAERTKHLFGKDSEAGPGVAKKTKTKKKVKQPSLFEELDEAEEAGGGWKELKGPPPGATILDRLHQAMILFGAQRGELLKRFLVEDGVGKDARFWKLADNLVKLYPPGTDERRWVEGVLARKKGLGL